MKKTVASLNNSYLRGQSPAALLGISVKETSVYEPFGFVNKITLARIATNLYWRKF